MIVSCSFWVLAGNQGLEKTSYMCVVLPLPGLCPDLKLPADYEFWNTVCLICFCVSPPELLELFPNIQLAPLWQGFCCYREQIIYILFCNCLINITPVIVASSPWLLSAGNTAHFFSFVLHTFLLCCLCNHLRWLFQWEKDVQRSVVSNSWVGSVLTH